MDVLEIHRQSGSDLKKIVSSEYGTTWFLVDKRLMKIVEISDQQGFRHGLTI